MLMDGEYWDCFWDWLLKEAPLADTIYGINLEQWLKDKLDYWYRELKDPPISDEEAQRALDYLRKHHIRL